MHSVKSCAKNMVFQKSILELRVSLGKKASFLMMDDSKLLCCREANILNKGHVSKGYPWNNLREVWSTPQVVASS